MKHLKLVFVIKILFSIFVFSAFVFSLASCSKPGDVTVNKAMESYQKKDYERALAFFIQALDEKKSGEKDSNYSEEILCDFIANVYMQQGDFENANIYLERFLAVTPDYRMFVQLGRNYREIEDNKNAEIAYNKAISLNPNKGEAYASLGALNIAEENYSDAVENLSKAAELEPKISVIHANLAVALSLNGDKDSAEKEFKIAKELKCENLEDFRERAGM